MRRMGGGREGGRDVVDGWMCVRADLLVVRQAHGRVGVRAG